MPRRAHAHNTHPMSYGAMHALRAGGSAGRAEAQQLIGDDERGAAAPGEAFADSPARAARRRVLVRSCIL